MVPLGDVVFDATRRSTVLVPRDVVSQLIDRTTTWYDKLAFHDTDILADFRARIVHEPDTHEDPH